MSIVLRNLPQGATEQDIRLALSSFGTVTDVNVFAQANQATVSMSSPHEAQMVASTSVAVNGAVVAVEMQQLQQGFGQQPPQQYQQQQQQQQYQPPPQQQQFMNNQHQQQPPYAQPPVHQPPQQPPAESTTLKVVVANCRYPIDNKVLTEVFTMVAPPKSVQCGPSNDTTIAHVEFVDAATTTRAMQQMQGKSIYPECCTMSISVVQSPPAQQPVLPTPGYGQGQPVQQMQQQQQQQHQQQQPPGYVPQQQQQFFNNGQQVMQMQPGMQQQQQQNMYQQQPPQFGQQQGFMPRGGGGRGMGAPYGRGGRGAGFTPTNGFAPNAGPNFASGGEGDATIVMVFNVPESIPLIHLWTLLEVYGNVLTLKRQYSCKKNVIARFQFPEDARSAVGFLSGCPFYGDVLSLKQFSGYQERGRTEWNVGEPTDATTLAYDFSGHHHRAKPNNANFSRKCRPREFLFVANLTEQITDDTVRELFTSKGFQLVDLERKSPTMVLVSLDSCERAVQCLCNIHGSMINDRYLKVSFSSFGPWSPHPNAQKDGNAAAAVQQDGAQQQNNNAHPPATAEEEIAANAQPPAEVPAQAEEQ